MLKQTITFKDLYDNEIKDDFYFNINKAELSKLVMTTNDPEKWLQDIIASGDGQVIIDTFEMIVKLAYGVKSDDGRRFIKTEEVWLEFYQSDAYSEFFMQLVTQADFGAKFINGVMPPGLLDETMAELGHLTPPKITDVPLPGDTKVTQPATFIPKDPKKLRPHHIIEMSDEEFEAFGADRQNLVLVDNDTLLAMYQRKAEK